MIYVEVLAGGKGTRMGNTDMPKQFLMLASKPVFIHTVEQFLLNNEIDRILICCPQQWMAYTKDTVIKYIGNNDKVHVIEGGATRNDTIYNGCKYIEDNFGLSDEDIIITHDAVRPFITQRIINDNIAGAKKCGAVDTVVAAVDTIVQSTDGKYITNIPVRSHMYQGQTPQTFQIKKLIALFLSLNEEEKRVLTDACKAFVIKGEPVLLVDGEPFNIKITTQYDLKIANSIIEEREIL